jgi:hypothetical protein
VHRRVRRRARRTHRRAAFALLAALAADGVSLGVAAHRPRTCPRQVYPGRALRGRPDRGPGPLAELQPRANGAA